MATKKPAAKTATKKPNRSTKTEYPQDDGAVNKKTVKKVQQAAPKPKAPVKKKTQLFDVKPEEPGVYIGNYSVRTVDNDGKVSFDIDWDRLREHMKTV